MKHFLFLFLVLTTQILVAQTTVITGTVIDKSTKEPLPYATIQFDGTATGTTTDIDGNFEIKTTDLTLNRLIINYLGYNIKEVKIKPGRINEEIIKLSEESSRLQTVEIRAKRKTKKDSKAIALYKRVIKNKDKNKPDHYDSYAYEEYVKTQFDIHNIKEKLTKRKVLKPIDFIFENLDTTETGTVYLPLLLKEKLSSVSYRKDIDKNKRIVKADQFSGVDNDNLSANVDYSFPEIDIYKNNVLIGGKAFISPFSNGATITYKYFLTDSTTVDDRFVYKLEFTPRRKGDLAFTGAAWIDKETAAIQSLDVYILESINLNFVSGLKFRQQYSNLGGNDWFKSFEQMEVLANLTENKKHQAVRITKSTYLYDIVVNQEIAKTTFDGDALEIQKDYNKREDSFWQENRKVELSDTEENIYTYVERIKETRMYKVGRYLGQSLGTGYFNVGTIEIGRWFQIWSKNALEGNRYRLGFRTDPKRFRDRFMIEGYGAYGDKDKLFKYHISSKIHLKRENKKWHMLGMHYRYDWSDYNFRNSYMTHDHTLATLLRSSPLDNLFLIREGRLFYEKEWFRGFTNKFNFVHKTIYQWPGSFSNGGNFEGENFEGKGESAFEALELSIGTRWGLDQVFRNFGGGFEREQVDINAPVLNFNYAVGIKGLLGGDYAYHKLSADFSQKIVTKLGRSYYQIGGEKIFGEIPYPLLTIHKGNDGWLYNQTTYNMMDDLEFVNDAYLKFKFEQFFDGAILNAIPLVSKLKMRTGFHFKAIYGGLSKQNQDFLSTDNNLNDLNGYYAEAGVSLYNIGKILEVHAIWRLTQLDKADVTKFAVKFYINPSF